MAGLWKRGSIATEPLLSIDQKPLMLLDILSTKGMSGSPIVRRVLGPATTDAPANHLQTVCTDEFIGVYAGRLGSEELRRVGVGYAWHGKLVDEVISAGVPRTETISRTFIAPAPSR
jgi:hypothetical protein